MERRDAHSRPADAWSNKIVVATTTGSGSASGVVSSRRPRRMHVPLAARLAIAGVLGSLLLPRGADLQIGSILIDAPRVVLTCFSLIGLHKVLMQPGLIKWSIADLAIGVHVLLFAASAVFHVGSMDGLELAISVLIDMGAAYFVARVFVANRDCYSYYVRALLGVAAFLSVFGCIESLTGYSPLRGFLHMFFPRVHYV